MKSSTSKRNVHGGGGHASAKKHNEHAKDPANAGQDVGPPGRPQPDKQAPGKHPRGRDPIPEKLPGR